MKMRNWRRTLAAAAALLLVLTCLIGPAAAAQADTSMQATCWVNMRAAASSRSEVLLVVPSGASVSVSGKSGGTNWYKATYKGTTGYIYSKYLSAGGSSDSGSWTRTVAENLFMRSSMSRADDRNVIRTIPGGRTVTILSEESDNWYKVSYKGDTGYIRGGHFTDDKSRLGIGSIDPERKKVRVNLNLRSSMSTSADNVMLVIPKIGTVTMKTKEANNWFKVSYNGTTGYIKGGYFA